MRFPVFAAAVWGALSTDAAILTLDHFSDPSEGQSAVIIGSTAGSATSYKRPAASVIGGWRTIGIGVQDAQPDSTGPTVRVNTTSSGSRYVLTSPDEIDPVASLVWDGNGTPLNLDLSQSFGVGLWGIAVTHPTLFSLTFATSGAEDSTATLYVPGGYEGELYFYWALFGETVNRSDIDAIRLSMDPERGGGVSIEGVFATVPEPIATLPVSALLGLGLLLRRSRR